MQAHQLVAQVPRRFVVTTDSKHALPVATNQLDRHYQVAVVPEVNRVRGGDITYVPTAEGWLYVAVVLDLKSRRVVGWGMAATREQELVSGALEMALGSVNRSRVYSITAIAAANTPVTVIRLGCASRASCAV
jgi:transposase InsO family protein